MILLRRLGCESVKIIVIFSTELPSYRVTELPSYRVTELPCYRVAVTAVVTFSVWRLEFEDGSIHYIFPLCVSSRFALLPSGRLAQARGSV